MMLRAALAIVLVVAATAANAQSGKRPEGRERQMSPEQRERMRDDMRDAYRPRDERPQKTQQMSPEERGKLRRDIEDANRNLKR
jgi:hypothetical protein